MKTTTLLLLCSLLCLALFAEAHKGKEGKPRHGRDHNRHGRRDHDDRREHPHKICPRLEALTWNELGYLQTYDNTFREEKAIALGEARFDYFPNGEIEVTCKCRPANSPASNTACQLKFNNGYDSFFYSRNATSVTVNGDRNGHFDLVKTKGALKIKCDKKTREIQVNGVPLTHYTCFSGVFKEDVKAAPISSGVQVSCPPLKSLSWTDLVKYSNTWANLPYRLQPIAMGKVSFNDTPKGIEMTCHCKPAKGNNNYCALEFDNGFDSYWTKNATAINVNNNKNGHFDVIKSKNFVSIKCDSSTGKISVNGTALTNYVCYSAHFFNDCELPPTGNVANCGKHKFHHSKSHSHPSSAPKPKESSKKSKGSSSGSDESR